MTGILEVQKAVSYSNSTVVFAIVVWCGAKSKMFPSKVDWPVKNSMLKCKHVKQDTHGCTVEEANATSSDRHICQDFTLSIVSGHGPVTMPYVRMYVYKYICTYVCDHSMGM